MWQFAPMAAALVLLMVGTVAMFYFLAPDGEIPVNPQGGIPNGIVWLVEPTLNFGNSDFEGLAYCEGCDVFYKFDTDWDTFRESEIIDEKTGLLTGEEYSHNTNFNQFWWIHDRELWKFGCYEDGSGSGVRWFDDGEFDLIERSDEGILIVHQIDSAMTYTNERGEWLENNSHQGVFMSYRSDSGLTNYNCTLYANGGFGRSVSNVESFVDFNNKHGIVDKNNNVLIPFAFEAIFIISETTAFARVGDYWGILEIPPIRPPVEISVDSCGEYCVGGNHSECPPYGTLMKDGDRFNNIWSVVEYDFFGDRVKFGIVDNDGNVFADGTVFDSITDFGDGKYSGYTNDFNGYYSMLVVDNELILEHILLTIQHYIFNGSLVVAIEDNNFDMVQDQLQLYERAVELLMAFDEDYQSTIESEIYDINPFQLDESIVEFLQGDSRLESIFQINVSPYYYHEIVLSSVAPVNVTITLYTVYDDVDSKREIAVDFSKSENGEYRVFNIYHAQ